MGNAATAATRGQAELDLGAVQPRLRPLMFCAAPNGRHFVDFHGGCVYEIRRYGNPKERCCWHAKVRRMESCQTLISVVSPTLAEAVDLLQSMAATMGAAA